MEKVAGIQEFSKFYISVPFEELKHVFVSNQLKVVSGNGIEYVRDFNDLRSSQILVVSKYQKLSDLEKSIKNNNFFFSSPESWYDPFELKFYKPQIKINTENNITIHACCFACNDIDNEEGFWQIWSKGEKDTIVRVTYNVEKLLKALDSQANNQYEFYLAGVEYKSRGEIMKQEKKASYEKIDDYLNMLCLKRNAYKYEHELRLFVKKKATKDDQDNNTQIKGINYCDGIITEITLPPAEPFGNSHPSKDKIKQYQDCVNSLAYQRLQKLIDSELLKCEINQSALYCDDIQERTYKVNF